MEATFDVLYILPRKAGLVALSNMPKVSQFP